MSTSRKYESIKEIGEGYFVEYLPPISDNKFATLQLIFTKDNNKNDVADAMEQELKKWLNRYPIPLFVSAFDNKGNLFNLDGIKTFDHLIGFFDPDNKICLRWKSLKDEEIPNVVSDQEYVDNLYANLNYKTYAELDNERQKKRQKIKLGWIIFFIWLVIIPAFIAIFENYNNWISLIAMIYSIYKAIQKGFKLTGKWPKSKKEKEKEIKEQLKDHYYYHCQMNPEGFNRLKIENFEKMEMDEIAKEVESLNMNTN